MQQGGGEFATGTLTAAEPELEPEGDVDGMVTATATTPATTPAAQAQPFAESTPMPGRGSAVLDSMRM